MRGVGPSLHLSRVLGLVGGLGLLAAFYMPWFSSQGLLLSGHFLHTFLTSASAADLRRFLPSSSPSEIQLLRVLVDLFPVCGALAAVAALVGGLSTRATHVLNLLLAASGLVPLLAWAGGTTRLPPGSSPESGLWLISVGSIAVLVSALLEFLAGRRAGSRR